MTEISKFPHENTASSTAWDRRTGTGWPCFPDITDDAVKRILGSQCWPPHEFAFSILPPKPVFAQE